MDVEMQNKHFEKKKTTERGDDMYWNPTETLLWFDITLSLNLPDQHSR